MLMIPRFSPTRVTELDELTSADTNTVLRVNLTDT